MNTKGTFLVYEESDASVATYTIGNSSKKWAVLYPITQYPDINDERGTNDATTLSDQQKIYEFALPDSGGSKDFDGYLKKIEDVTDFNKKFGGKVLRVGVVFGGTDQDDGVSVVPTGGTIVSEFNAYVEMRITGAGVDETRPISISVQPTTDVQTYPTTA